jgi:hypothetical protein
MFDFTKEEALEAAAQFCCGLYEWTRTFTGSPCDVVLKQVNGSYDTSLLDTESFRGGYFIHNISVVFDFAETGTWEGTNIVESTWDTLDSLCEVMTELSPFTEVFYKDLHFLDLYGNELLDGRVGDRWSLEILRTVIRAAFARYFLISGSPLVLEDIALLAGVSLKTVQNAASSKGKDRLVVSDSLFIGKSAATPEEALRWLTTKKGYTGPFFLDVIPSYEQYETLGQLKYHCELLLKKADMTCQDVAKKLKWKQTTCESLANLLKLRVDESLDELTPAHILEFGQLTTVENLKTFVREASKIIASSVAEFKANNLEIQ